MSLLRIVGLVTGGSSPFDGLFVKRYDPSYHPEGEEYDGGILEVTSDPAEALHFAGPAEALECWRQSYGVRADGKPNRPLTAFSCEVL